MIWDVILNRQKAAANCNSALLLIWEKAAQKAKQEGEPVPGVSGELIENSEYLKGTKATTTLAPAWVFIILMAVGVFVLFVYQVNK